MDTLTSTIQNLQNNKIAFTVTQVSEVMQETYICKLSQGKRNVSNLFKLQPLLNRGHTFMKQIS